MAAARRCRPGGSRRNAQRLYLADAAPLVRERLAERFRASDKIEVLAPEDVERLPDASLDLVVANSLLQYLSADELRGLLRLWRTKLKAGGRLVLADVIPPDLSPAADAKALLGFAWQGGFCAPPLFGLARTALLGLPPHPQRARARDLRRRRR